jgi:hypothetical protein
MTAVIPEPTQLSPHAAIEVCNRFFNSIDARDWDSFDTCLAHSVTTDFTAFWGGDPQTTSRAELRATWTSLFAGFDSTQHLVSNYVTQPSDSGLSVHVAFRAVHFGQDPYGSPSWTLYGRYHIDLVPDGPEYRITRLHQTPTAGEGNRNIVLLAAAAASWHNPESRPTVPPRNPQPADVACDQRATVERPNPPSLDRRTAQLP